MASYTVDRITGIIAALLGVTSISEGLKLYPLGKGLLSGDHVFPIIIGAVLVVAGAVLAVKGDKASAGRSEETEKTGSKQNSWHILYIPAALLVYLQVINWFGYLISTVLVSIALFRWIGKFKLGLSVLAGIALGVILYIVFVKWLNTPLPGGKWPLGGW